MSMTRIGILALQGGFAAHAEMVRRAGADPVEVRHPELAGLAGLILPGGETTTLLNLMQDAPWFAELSAYHAAGGALWGTCAGAILLSRKVRGPEQPSLGLLDAEIERNAYGRQVDSFEVPLDLDGLGGTIQAVFIRAPRFTRIGPEVEVLGRIEDQPVFVRQGRILAATFHPELSGDDRIHRCFIELAARCEPIALTR